MLILLCIEHFGEGYFNPLEESDCCDNGQPFVHDPRFSINSEVKASELIENLEEMFALYYMCCDDCSNL